MNILFITADQWRGECLSCLNHPVVKTPNLDSLASEGVLFKKHYAQAAPCAPSRTSIHTGTYMFHNRCVKNGTPLSNRFTNWALEVSKFGYKPSLFGYTDTAIDPEGVDPKDDRLKHYSEPLPGFVDYTPIVDETPVEWVDYLAAKGYEIPDFRWDLVGKRVPGETLHEGGDKVLPLAIAAEDHDTRFMTNKCIDWIAKQKQPWITHLSLLRPHPPFAAPSPYHTLYPVDETVSATRHESAGKEAAQHPYLNHLLDGTKYACSQNVLRLQEDRANYYGLMTEVDDNLGRLFCFLKESHQWDNTLIIFTTDHGEQMGDHWLMSKVGFYDQSYFIPLIVRDPRARANTTRGKQRDVFTENVDLMPTMLDWLGTDIPSQCDGSSLLPLLYSSDTPASWRKEVYWEYDFRDVLNQKAEKRLGINSHQCNLSVVRDNDFKCVHFAALPPLLFDLKKDPEELQNLADDPDHHSVLLSYTQKLLSWRMRFADRALTETFLCGEGPVTVHQSP